MAKRYKAARYRQPDTITHDKENSENPIQSERLNFEKESIKSWLEEVRFKKAFFGGVDEADVWKKIGELNSLYESALRAERARFDALLEERVSFSKILLKNENGERREDE